MSKTMRLTTALVISAALVGSAGVSFAGSLENLERERALAVAVMLDPETSPDDRAARVIKAQHRLVDLERMVLRDRSLRGKNTPKVQKAFDNYDLTFLVHASVESEYSLMDHWLHQVGISTGTLMASRTGSR
jgi:hypothetical protein